MHGKTIATSVITNMFADHSSATATCHPAAEKAARRAATASKVLTGGPSGLCSRRWTGACEATAKTSVRHEHLIRYTERPMSHP